MQCDSKSKTKIFKFFKALANFKTLAKEPFPRKVSSHLKNVSKLVKFLIQIRIYLINGINRYRYGLDVGNNPM